MKQPKDSPTAQPTTAPESTRLTPSEIDALREDARQMDAKFRAYTRRDGQSRRFAGALW
jgi:hypothetical protein